MARGFRYVAFGFDIMYIQKKQVQGSRRLDFVIKVTFPKWKSLLSSFNEKMVWKLEVIRIQRSHVLVLKLVFESKLKFMVSI